MIKAIIIDDEQHCIDRLLLLLKPYEGRTLELSGVFLSYDEGLKAIREEKPSLVFLDVQIHEKTAFALLQELDRVDFEVIFTTAYEKYAVQAFRFSALDYLLKPIDPEDLATALSRLQEKISREERAGRFDTLFHNLKNIQGPSRKICVPVLNGLVFIEVNDIIRCESQVNYTTLFLINKQKLTVARTLKEFEEMLSDYNFFRVHNSHLINLAYIKSYHKGKGGTVTMTDESLVEVSTRRKEEFLKKVSEP